jgi:hypothetical protein
VSGAEQVSEHVNSSAQAVMSVSEHLTWLAYRMSSYLLLNVADDAALLALVFC